MAGEQRGLYGLGLLHSPRFGPRGECPLLSRIIIALVAVRLPCTEAVLVLDPIATASHEIFQKL